MNTLLTSVILILDPRDSFRHALATIRRFRTSEASNVSNHIRPSGHTSLLEIDGLSMFQDGYQHLSNEAVSTYIQARVEMYSSCLTTDAVGWPWSTSNTLSPTVLIGPWPCADNRSFSRMIAVEVTSRP